jgi:integrase
MLHKAEEWRMVGHAPKIKMMKEHGRHLRLDDEAERKLVAGAEACKWRQRTRELFCDIVILMRDRGMRNQRELYRMRIENLDWENRVIFVPDSKTPEGKRLVPMCRRVFELLRARCGPRTEGWCFRPSVPLRVTCAPSIAYFGRRGSKPVFRKNWFFIVLGMTTAHGFSCGPGTWPPS